MIPIPRAELVLDYGRERRVLGAVDDPFFTQALAKVILRDAQEVAEDFAGVDDAIAAEAIAETDRLRALLDALLPGFLDGVSD